MRKNYYLLSFIFILSFFSLNVHAQGVAINADGSAPDASAMLDVKSTVAGFLVPRMTIAKMYSISSPADGLIVFSTTDHSLYLYNTTNAWTKIIAGEDDDWTLSGSDMYNNNSGNVGIGNATVTATHRLTIEDNASSDVLRLVGPGSFGSTAKLNFGDGDYTYISEYQDDHLMIYGSSSLDFNSNYNITASSNYGNLLLAVPNGGVGINLVGSPTAALDVDGTLRFRQTAPAPYKVLTSIDLNGNATWMVNRTLEFPDGQFPMVPVNHRFDAGNFTVPSGKNLYITNTFSQYGSSNVIYINGVQIFHGYNNYYSANTFEGPAIVGSGQVVSASYNQMTFSGFLVDATVQPITVANSFTVPAGQEFVITSICTSGSSAQPLLIDGKIFYYGYGNYNGNSGYNYHGLREPIPVASGSTIQYQFINGYLITQ